MTNNTKKHIALVGTSANAAIQFRGDVIAYWVSQGHRVSVWCHDFDDMTRETVQSMGAQACDSPLGRSYRNPLRDIAAVWKLSRAFKRDNVDVMLSYFIKPVVFASFAAVLAGVKSRYAMIEGLGWAFTAMPTHEKRRGKLLRIVQLILMYISLPLARAVIFLNADDQHCLRDDYKIPMRRSVVLGAIGAPRAFFDASPVPDAPMRFVFVARLLFDKGIREFIAAAKQIKQAHPEICFDIYGDIDAVNPRSLSTAECDALRAENIVTFHGYSQDMLQVYAAASCLVLPSYREGFPRTVQEAMAMGRPAIVSDVPGCRQSVIDGKTGFVVPPFDADALAQAMEALINDPKMLRNMGAAAHDYACEHYDGLRQAQALDALVIPR